MSGIGTSISMVEAELNGLLAQPSLAISSAAIRSFVEPAREATAAHAECDSANSHSLPSGALELQCGRVSAILKQSPLFSR